MSHSFADLGVPPNIVSSLSARRIDEAFPIQAATIPDALEGRDLCGRAPTGSGKTIAFGIPLVLGVGKARPRRPRGLVLLPTRELAAQVCQELQLLAKPKGPWAEAFYGGVGFDRQIKALQKGVDIVVACPGRLADLINQKYLSLEEVEFVVIDEADRMANMGFLPEVRRLLDMCPKDRQTLLFSATLDGDVDVLISKYQRNPVRHELIADDDGGEVAEHFFWSVDREQRLRTAAEVIKRLGPTVVFCRTKRGADRIAKQLENAGVKSAAIHGDRSQNQRERALASFHRGQVLALVATDVAARGIHVDGVEGVVHFDPPADHKDYVHRSGRTARAGQRGVVVSLVPPDMRKPVAQLQKDLGYPVGLEPVDLPALTAARSGEPVNHPGDRAARSTAAAETAAPATADRSGDHRGAGATVAVAAAATAPARRHSADRRDRSRTADNGAASTGREVREIDDTSSSSRPTDADRRADVNRSSAPAARHAGPTPAPRIERISDLAPLDGGQRRPSGAARRKAKRLAATEAVVLDGDARTGGRTESRSGAGRSDSSRPAGSRTPSRAGSGDRRGPAGRDGRPSRSSGPSSSAGRSSGSGRSSGPGRSSSNRSNGSGRTGSSRPAGSRGRSRNA